MTPKDLMEGYLTVLTTVLTVEDKLTQAEMHEIIGAASKDTSIPRVELAGVICKRLMAAYIAKSMVEGMKEV